MGQSEIENQKSKITIPIAICCSVLFWLIPPCLAKEINLVGTDNGEAAFKAIASAFERQYPDITVKVPENIDSGGGIKAVATGDALIARVARDFNEREKAYGLTYMPFAKIQIVFFVNKSAGIRNLSAKQICDIYSGKILNWEAVGGQNGKIRVVTREQGDSATETLEENLPGFENIKILSRSKTVYNEEDALKTVERKKGAIGFGTYGVVKYADVDIVSVDNKNIDDPEYPLAHPLGLVFHKKNKTGAIAKFADFVRSEAAHEAIRKAGAVPLEK